MLSWSPSTTDSRPNTRFPPRSPHSSGARRTRASRRGCGQPATALAVPSLCSLQLRGSDVAPDVLGLIYANTHLGADDGSMISNGHGFALVADDVTWFNRQSVPDRSRWSAVMSAR